MHNLHGNLLGLSTYVNHHLYLNEFITRYFLHIVKINSFHIKLIKQLNKLPFLCLVCEDLCYLYILTDILRVLLFTYNILGLWSKRPKYYIWRQQLFLFSGYSIFLGICPALSFDDLSSKKAVHWLPGP